MPDLELLRALAPDVEPAPPEMVRRARRRMSGGRRRRPLLVATPVAVGVALLALVLTQLGGDRTFAEAAVRMAEASPRLLVDGWEVTRVDEWDARQGEMTFTHDDRQLELRWSGDESGAKELERVAVTRVAGARAVVGRYPATDDYVATWRARGLDVYARGVAPSPAAFLATLHAIEAVGVQEWLRALPQNAVAPKAQAAAVDAMLEGVPLPPGFDREALAGGLTRDRYQLGAHVTGAVACAWIRRWLAGDASAVAALQSAHDWRVLHDMNDEGDYPEVLWMYADAVARGGGVAAGKPGVTVADSYRDALGC